jgi:hypothetical protein
MEARNRYLANWYGRIERGELKLPRFQLANGGGYEGLSEEAKIEKLRDDFEAFGRRRAELVHRAVTLLADGRQVSLEELYGE